MYTDESIEDIVRREIAYPGPDGKPRHEVVRKSGKYWAIRNLETGDVNGLVVLSHVNGRNKSWKYVDDFMGPAEDDCPATILNLLTPTDNEYANDWRERCRKNIERKKAQPKVKEGDVIVFDEPIEFSNGMEVDRLRYEGGYRFRALDGQYGTPVRLHKSWKRTYGWKVGG